MADLVYPPVIGTIKSFWRYLGLRFTFTGESYIPRTGGAIIAMNHISYLDFALVGTAALPAKRYMRFMAKKEIFSHPIAGPLMRGMHHIRVDRESGAASYEQALHALHDGELLGIFPEATISTSFEIKAFKSGAIRMAQSAQVPIIPTVIWGSQRIWTKGVKRDLRRRNIPITVAFGEPLYISPEMSIEEGEKLLRAAMAEMLDRVQQRYPDSHQGQWWAPARLGGTAPAPLN